MAMRTDTVGPRHPLNSQFFYAAALQACLERSVAWLDLGCGRQFLPDWLPAGSRTLPLANRRVVGVDADVTALSAHPDLRLRIVASVERLPLASAQFDLVTANMVVEHVANPEALFMEVRRVLRPKGEFLLHTPNLAGYSTRLARLIPHSWRPSVARL